MQNPPISAIYSVPSLYKYAALYMSEFVADNEFVNRFSKYSD